MKKITLFAAFAALTASSAMAVAPVKADVSRESQRVDKVSMVGARAMKQDLKVNPVLTSNPLATQAEGDDETVTVLPEAQYVNAASSFYSGMGPGTNYFTYLQAFTGIRNAIGFRNLTPGADSYTWKYGKVTGLNEDRTDYTYDYTTSTDVNLFMELDPMERYSFPELSAKFGDDEVSTASDGMSLYHTGRNAYYWGWDFAAEDAEEITYNDLLGLSPCAAVPGGTLYGEYSISRPGDPGYNALRNDANGTSLDWYAYSEDDFKLENMTIDAFGTYIPAMPSPYQMDATWMWFQSYTKAPVALTVKVYSIDDEGRVDYNDLLGEGEVTLPEGNFFINQTTDMMVIELSAVDADGYAIDSPICVGEGVPVFVRLEGLENPDLLGFDMIAYSSTTFPIDAPVEVRRYAWPQHAYTIISADVTEGTATESTRETFMLSPAYLYYADEADTALATPSDFCMFFNIDFPVVMNADENSADYMTGNFSVTVPATGGEVTVPVACDYEVDVLMQEELVQTVSSPWLSNTQAYDEETGLTNVTITAEALPEGTAARTGYVVYIGYAIDFVIEVNQGEDSAIDSIVVKPVAKGTRFFDMQGRRLSAAPAHGMYIESVDGKATKHIAR